MQEVTVHDAKTQLSRLLKAVEEGETIIIKRGKVPIAKLSPLDSPSPRLWGQDKGRVHIADDFNAPLPPEIQVFFE